MGIGGGDHREAGEDELGDAVPVESVHVGLAEGRVTGAVLGREDVQARPLVAVPRPALRAVRTRLAVHPVDVGGVDVALEGLRPVALLQHHDRRVDLLGRQRVDLEGREWRRARARAHVRPDHAVDVAARVRAGPHLVPERALRRHARHVDAAADHVELPAVVDAAEPALLVATVEERRAAVRAVLGDEPDLAPAVAEGDQVLAEQPHLLRRAVGRGQLVRGQAGHPVLAQQPAHGRATADPTEKLVVLVGEHVSSGAAWPAPGGTCLRC